MDLNAFICVRFAVILRRSHAAYACEEVLTAGAVTAPVILRDRPAVFPDLSVIAELKRCRKAAAIALEDVCLLYMKWHRLLLSFVQIATPEAVIRADECTHKIEILLHQLGDPGVPLYILLFSFAA